MKFIDLSADIAEGLETDEEVVSMITSANLCCGEHAGSKTNTEYLAELCLASGVSIGAHPGVPDRSNFGRGDFAISEELKQSLQSQVRFVQELGAKFIKLHGSIYNRSAQDLKTARFVVECFTGFGLPFVGLENTFHSQIASELGVHLIKEGIADRRLTNSGTLVPRSQPNALISKPQEVCSQALHLADLVDVICLHGDGPNATHLIKSVRKSLESHGFQVRSCT